MSTALLSTSGTWLLVAVVMAAFLWLGLGMADWWVWVGQSAFRGTRAPADSALGVESVLAAELPFVAALGAVVCARRLPSPRRRLLACASVGLLGAVVSTACALLLSGPL